MGRKFIDRVSRQSAVALLTFLILTMITMTMTTPSNSLGSSSSEASSSKHVASRTASSVHDISSEKPPFGARFLREGADVWSHNAWDHVPPPDDQGETIAAALAKQHLAPVPEEDKPRYNEQPARHWDNFYKMNASNFFRNRKWLHIEFPELLEAAKVESGPMTIAEIGCGAGNAVFPLLSTNENPQLHLKAYDYSAEAVKLVKENPLYQTPPLGTIHADVWDLSSTELPADLEPESVDIVILVFVLSALHPHEWHQAIRNIHKILKPGGRVMLRDYGRYDLAQLRFKGGRLLEENFYIRGDKTRVYFFELDELALLFTGAIAPSVWKQYGQPVKVEEEGEDGDTPRGLTSGAEPTNTLPSRTSPELSSSRSPSSSQEELDIISAGIQETPTVVEAGIHPSLLSQNGEGSPPAMFSIEQLGVDRRLIVNRKRQLKMYRVWMQAKFQKVS